MCNRYVSPDQAAIEREWHIGGRNGWRGGPLTDYPSGEVAPRKRGPFVRRTRDGERELVVGRWQLVPASHKQPLDVFKLSTNNARWEDKVRTARSYKPSWENGRRCIIPAVWFIEPCWEGNVHVPWRFERPDGGLWGLAGLWNTWTNPETGEIVETYTMITQNADRHPLMNRMHKPDPDDPEKRMVVPIADGQQEQWLSGTPDEAAALVRAWPDDGFNGIPMPMPPKQPKPSQSVRRQASAPEQGELL